MRGAEDRRPAPAGQSADAGAIRPLVARAAEHVDALRRHVVEPRHGAAAVAHPGRARIGADSHARGDPGAAVLARDVAGDLVEAGEVRAALRLEERDARPAVA